jgi:hypothetical protein
MARNSDTTTLLIVPVAPDLVFTLSDATRFFMSHYRVPRQAGASLLRTLKRVLGDLPSGAGTARLTLQVSQGELRIRLGLSRVRLSESRLRSLLRDAHPSLNVTTGSSGAHVSFRIPFSERR